SCRRIPTAPVNGVVFCGFPSLSTGVPALTTFSPVSASLSVTLLKSIVIGTPSNGILLRISTSEFTFWVTTPMSPLAMFFTSYRISKYLHWLQQYVFQWKPPFLLPENFLYDRRYRHLYLGCF